MQEREKPTIFPFQLDLSSRVISHLETNTLNKLDPKASSILNNVAGPDISIEFASEAEASKAVLDLVSGTLDLLWEKRVTKDIKEQQLINHLTSLKKKGLNKEQVIERLRLHFAWNNF